MNFDFSELDKFEARLDQAVKRMPRLGIKITEKSADRMMGEARRVVRRRTGQTASDIRLIRKGSMGANRVGVEFGVDSRRRGFVAVLLEGGFTHYRSGQKIGPYPFLSVGLERYGEQWKDRLVKGAVDSITGGGSGL